MVAAQRMALGLCYDGSAWHGWQTQPSGHTVQDQVEKALSTFLVEPVSTICAGRTDSGVHALNQVVHFDTQVQRPAESWVRGVNAFLPSSIAVQWAQPVSTDFSARFSAQSRRYLYVLRNARVRSPILHQRVGWVFRPLCLQRMQEAAQLFLGTHDFSAFRSSECQAISPIRTLRQLTIHHCADWFVFEFEADGFLHHMIRNLMGVLVFVGTQRQSPQWVTELLAAKDRSKAAPTFSAEGLYLAGVDYPDEFQLPRSTNVESTLSHLGINWQAAR